MINTVERESNLFILNRKNGGGPVLMKSGKPFTYSSRALAKLGSFILSKELEEPLTIASAV